MINRVIIRLKVLQLIYAYYMNGNKNVEQAEKTLLESLSKAYELYQQMLLLVVAVTRLEAEQVEEQEQLNRVAHKNTKVSHRLADNRLARMIDENLQLLDFREHQGMMWTEERSYVAALLQHIKQADFYQDYESAEQVDFADDRELWRKIYKNIIMPDERIDAILEERSLYWNDDRETVDTFVLKTIKRFDETDKETAVLLPEFKDSEDQDFAIRLLRHTIMNEDEYRSLIAQSVQNWEMERMAFMDILILQMAIAEIMSFPQIPLSVSINEYVEIAKLYSTPKSYSYVNGMLDHVSRRLIQEGKVMKR